MHGDRLREVKVARWEHNQRFASKWLAAPRDGLHVGTASQAVQPGEAPARSATALLETAPQTVATGQPERLSLRGLIPRAGRGTEYNPCP